MKKIILLGLLLSVNGYAQEEEKNKTQYKFGVESTKGTVGSAKSLFEFYSFDITSWSFHIEKPIWREIGFGLGFRKEEKYAYDGYCIDLYARYKQKLGGSPFALHTSGGFTLGLPSSEYDYYNGDLWVFIKQDLRSVTPSKTLVLHPTFGLGLEIPVYKFISIEPGITMNLMTFGIKGVHPPIDEYRRWLVPTYRIRLVISH